MVRNIQFFTAALITVVITGTASAFSVSPGSGNQLIPPPSSSSTGTPTIEQEINDELADRGLPLLENELYKDNVGGGESGNFSDDYTTSYSPDEDDPSGFTISLDDDGTAMTTARYLLVKDGNQEPSYYLFDLAGWDGSEDIDGSGFWPTQGAISHVSIYGGAIPEPTTIVSLIGLGLCFGIGACSRRRNDR